MIFAPRNPSAMLHTLDPTEFHFVIREECADDLESIDAVVRDAFRTHAFSGETERRIVHGLRSAGALALSLVATAHGDVIGHVAFSPVSIDGAEGSWWCLGPLSVATAHRRSGVGSSLIRSGLRRLADRRVDGCVVSGDPDYYQRFGFGPSGGLYRPAPPADPFMALAVGGVLPAGRVEYHAAFGVNR